jgi:flagella basal body P-ring formation protein FlgA
MMASVCEIVKSCPLLPQFPPSTHQQPKGRVYVCMKKIYKGALLSYNLDKGERMELYELPKTAVCKHGGLTLSS